MFSSKTVFKNKKMFFLIILIILLKFVHSLSKIYIYISQISMNLRMQLYFNFKTISKFTIFFIILITNYLLKKLISDKIWKLSFQKRK